MPKQYTTLVSSNQIDQLMTFIREKSGLNSIELSFAESKLFFAESIAEEIRVSSQIYLHQAFAEISWYNSDDIFFKKIIPREKIIGEIDFYSSYTSEVETSKTYYNPFMKALLTKYIEILGFESLLDKLSNEISRMFPISKGQSQAVMKKIMGFTLTSGDRSFLHDLRKKIVKYKILINEFHVHVMKPEETSEYGMKWVNKIFNDAKSELKTSEDKTSKVVSEFRAAIEEYNSRHETERAVPKLEKDMHISHVRIYYECVICNYTEDLPKEFIENDKTLDVPTHCDKLMNMKFGDNISLI